MANNEFVVMQKVQWQIDNKYWSELNDIRGANVKVWGKRANNVKGAISKNKISGECSDQIIIRSAMEQKSIDASVASELYNR